MKKIIATAAAILMGATAAHAADPLEGVWQTQVDDGAFAHVTIAPCAAALCGTITRTFNTEGEYKSENIGRQIVIDMVPAGNGRYKGSVWRPSNDRIYIGRIELAGDALKMKGCVAGGLLCASQAWARVK